MGDKDNGRRDMEGSAPEKKDIFKDIETDIDLSFFDRDKRRTSGDGKRSLKDIRSRRKNGGPDGRLLLAVIGGIAALVIIIAIVMAVTSLGGAEGTKESAEAVLSEASGGAEAEVMETEAEQLLKLCDIPEISMLIEEYFNYRLSADVEGLYRVFGRAEDAYMDTAREKLSAQAGWIQGFNNIEVYIAPGLDETSRVAFIRYDINFRRTDTDAPGIMYCYIEKDAEGAYVIRESLESDKYEYIESLLSEPSVDELITETDNALSNALSYDSDLALIYTSFMNGAIYEESNFDPEREPEVNLFTDPSDSVLIESTAAEETASEEADVSETELSEVLDETETAEETAAQSETAGKV